MSMFTLAISYLTISYLPWFMDVAFRVLMQYCSLHHQTLLSPADTSTTGHCLHFGSTSSFFLELLLCSAPVVYWIPTNLGVGLYIYILPFHGNLKARILKWLALPFSAAAVKSFQSCPTLCDPINSSSPVSAIPGILQARTLEWVAISLSNAWKWKVKVKLLSRVRLVATSWSAAYQAPPSMGFSRQEYWSGVPLPSPFLSLLDQILLEWKVNAHFNRWQKKEWF